MPGAPQETTKAGTKSHSPSFASVSFIGREQGIRGSSQFSVPASQSGIFHPASSFTASRKTRVCWSTSSFSVAGDINAMLWKGVSKIPRFMA